MSRKIVTILSQGRKRGKMDIKKRKIKIVKVYAAEKGRAYGIDSLNLADTVHEADNDFIQGEDNAAGNDSE